MKRRPQKPDSKEARAYLKRQYQKEPWYFPYDETKDDLNRAARKDFNHGNVALKDVHLWIETHLNNEQIKRMISALRARKSRFENRHKSRVVSLTLNSEQYMQLLALTDQKNLQTVSDVIKKKLFT